MFQRYCRFLLPWPHPYSTLIWGCSRYFRSIPTYVIIVPEHYRQIEHFGRSTSSKVVDFGTNRKRTCDFLLVRHSNLGPILHRFWDIAGFLCSWVTDPPLFHSHFGDLCPRWTRSPILGSARAESLSYSAVKLFSKYSNLCDHGTWTLITDRRTDGRTTYCGITALCVASRIKIVKFTGAAVSQYSVVLYGHRSQVLYIMTIIQSSNPVPDSAIVTDVSDNNTKFVKRH